MKVGLVYLIIIFAAVTTTLIVELIVGVRQGVAPELGVNLLALLTGWENP